MTENLVFSVERELFVKHLQNIIDIAKQNQTEVVIVGGIALRSAMDKPVEFKRPNGSTPDIDMIGLGPNRQNIAKTISDIDKYRKNFPDCPPVGLEPVDFSNKAKKLYSPIEFLSGLRKDDSGRFFLTFRSVEQEIDSLTMLPVSRRYGGIEIPTLPQETILNRYSIRGGYLKPKDINKIEEFCHHIEKTGGDHLDPSLFVPYVEFCQRINIKHPIVIKITKAYWNLDQKIGGKISGSNGFIYNLIKAIRR
jgi:hypothetical protein